VVGGGFAGAYVARLIGQRGATIVNPDNFRVYTPLLPEAAAGTLEPRHVVVPLRQMCPHAELLLGRAIARDPEARTVVAETLGGTFEIGYERLVVALGAVPRTFPIPGLADHGHGFKDVADAIALRNHLLRSL
jgi:NADH dehydrogenase